MTPAIDTHAHVFTSDCALVDGRRYTPDYQAPLARYLALLAAADVSAGVLVQPSFLGTDNGYLLDCLKAQPVQLRGVVVVDPSIPDAEMEAMANAGVAGIRYNLFGRDPAEISSPDLRALTRRAAELGWFVEIHVPNPDLPAVLDFVRGEGADVVVDHFGRPQTPSDPGFLRLLESDPGVWVKLSAPYRMQADPSECAAALLESPGTDRLLWGSDWPWTQHEDAHSYKACAGWLADWLSPPQIEALNRASRARYGFP